MRELAVVETSGKLMISSHSRYDRREYQLAGARAIIIDKGAVEDTAHQVPQIRIALNPSFQLDGTAFISFRLTSAADAAPWNTALAR